jgi:hypothetical protein
MTIYRQRILKPIFFADDIHVIIYEPEENSFVQLSNIFTLMNKRFTANRLDFEATSLIKFVTSGKPVTDINVYVTTLHSQYIKLKSHTDYIVPKLRLT